MSLSFTARNGRLSLFLAFIALFLGLGALATPSNPNAPDTAMQSRTAPAALPQNSCGKRAVAYYVNWAIYARKYEVSQIPADQFTHINYAFANVHNVTGQVYLTDEWADIQRKAPTDRNETGNNIYGNLKQLLLLKKKYRNLKLLLSIGGWTYSKNLTQGLSTEAGRQAFAASATVLVQNYGFDGLDLDYEWANTTEKVDNFAATLEILREQLDRYAESIGKPKGQFLISFAAPAGPKNFEKINFPAFDKYLDFWNLMAYDYAGATFNESNLAQHSANWYPDHSTPTKTPYSTQAALDYYISHGVNAGKINVGIPLYGRSFSNTDGIGKPFSGNVSAGSWEPGVYDYKALPLPGAVVQEDTSLLASWSYDSKKKELISFDDVRIAQLKAKKVNELGLGGLMWWETSGDGTGKDSLIAAQTPIIKEEGLEYRLNVIEYPNSAYDNVRAGFPGE